VQQIEKINLQNNASKYIILQCSDRFREVALEGLTTYPSPYTLWPKYLLWKYGIKGFLGRACELVFPCFWSSTTTKTNVWAQKTF